MAKPRCKTHSDCFANKDGKCICLKNNKFNGKDCPFYKTVETAIQDRRRCEEKLIAEGKDYLIEQYGRDYLNDEEEVEDGD